MPPINMEANLQSLNTEKTVDIESQVTLTGVQEYLKTTEHIEHHQLKVLEKELLELFALSQNSKQQNMQFHRERLSEILKKMEDEKNAAYRKLDLIRHQLIEIDNSNSTDMSQNSSVQDDSFASQSEGESDAKMLGNIRERLRRLNENTFELKKQIQNLEIEKSGLANSLKTEKIFGNRSSAVLRELADLLCSWSGKQFSYTNMYEPECINNPFCEAVLNLKLRFNKREAMFMERLSERDREIEELADVIKDYPQQQDASTQIIENDASQQHIQELQATIDEKDNQIEKLNFMVTRLTKILPVPQRFDCCSAAQTMQSSQHESHAECGFSDVCIQLEKANHRTSNLLSELDESQKKQRQLVTETRNLTDELSETKRKNCELLLQLRRLSEMLTAQEQHRMEIVQSYESLENSFSNESKKLRIANTQLKNLQERLDVIESRRNEEAMERDLLRSEVFGLKEKEAKLLGQVKSMQDQVVAIERELFMAHDMVKKQQYIMQRDDRAHEEVLKKMEAASNELKAKLHHLLTEHKRLKEEYEEQKRVRAQNEKVIKSFRKWKEAQLRSDHSARISFQKYEEHISLLLEEKQRFMNNYRDLHRDYSILQNELDRLKMCALSTSLSGAHLGNTADVLQRTPIVQRTLHRVAQTHHELRDQLNNNDSPSSSRRTHSPSDLL